MASVKAHNYYIYFLHHWELNPLRPWRKLNHQPYLGAVKVVLTICIAEDRRRIAKKHVLFSFGVR